MHPFPANPVTRKLWVEFVRKHRPDFGKDPNKLKHASFCSAHFTETCYTRRLIQTEEGIKGIGNRVLISGSVPSVDSISPEAEANEMSERSRRQVSRSYKTKASSWRHFFVLENIVRLTVLWLHALKSIIWVIGLISVSLLFLIIC